MSNLLKKFFFQDTVAMHLLRFVLYTVLSMVLVPDLLSVVNHEDLFSPMLVSLCGGLLFFVNMVLNPNIKNK